MIDTKQGGVSMGEERGGGFQFGLALMPDGRIAIAQRENHRITVLKI